MKDKIKVLGIAGSLRKNSFNRALLKAAQELQPDNMEIETYDISDIPLYNDDELAETPQAVFEFKQKIAEAGALLIATPEYNYSIPGVLKNAIDWASRPPQTSPLNKKPLGIMGASNGLMGTVRAQMHLRQIAVYTNMFAMNKPELLVSKAAEKFDKNGKLTDEATRQHLRKFLEALLEWTLLFKNQYHENTIYIPAPGR